MKQPEGRRAGNRPGPSDTDGVCGEARGEGRGDKGTVARLSALS